MSLAARLAEVRRRHLRFPPDARSDAGHGAEYAAAARLRERLRRTGWQIHHGLRVPGRGGGRREIDFVLTTPDFGLVIELKSWIGEVRLEGDRLIQSRPPPRPPVDHGPVLGQLAHKSDLLARHHAEQGRPPVALRSLLVFFDHRVRLAPPLAGRDDVTTLPALLAALPQRDSTPVSEGIRALRATLDDLGGWDLVALYGGRVLFGDVVEIPSADRARHATLEVMADRSRLRALFASPRIRGRLHARGRAAAEVVALDPDAEVVVRPAGRRESERFALRHVLRVELSRRPPRG